VRWSWLIVLVAACGDDVETLSLSEHDQGEVACPTNGPDNGDGTHTLLWTIVFVTNPGGVACNVCGPSTSRTGSLVLVTNQVSTGGGVAVLPEGPFDIAGIWPAAPHLPVSEPLVGSLVINRGLEQVRGSGILEPASEHDGRIAGSFAADAVDLTTGAPLHITATFAACF
jgi:hypothetical protein